MLEDDLYAALTGSSEATDAEDRVYPLVAPQGAPLPRLTFQRVGVQPDQTLEHPPSGFLDLVRMQIDAWARTPEAARTLAQQVRRLMGEATFKGRVKNMFTTYESVTQIYRVTAEYTCWERST